MQQATATGFRLAPQQKRLWLLQRDGSTYNTQCAILLEGEVRSPVLRDALRKVVADHEILRTTFRTLPGMKMPIQVISPGNTPLWREVDLTAYKEDERRARLEELYHEDGLFAFDLEAGPTVRACLASVSAGRRVLIISIPAMCADRKAMSNLFVEMALAYSALLSGGRQPGEPVQYFQFSEWQNELLEAEDGEPGREYWRDQGLDAAPQVELPFQKRYAQTPALDPRLLPITVESDLAPMLYGAAAEGGVSAEAILLACWKILLWRLTGKADVAVGVLCDGRVYEEMREALGLYARSPLVRSHLDRNCRFIQFAGQVQKSLGDIREWQEYYSGESSRDETTGGVNNPPPPVGFEFEQLPDARQVAGLRLSIIRQYSWVDRFELKLSCAITGGALSLDLQHDEALLSGADVEPISRQMCAVLRSAISNPLARLDELEVLSASERRQILFDWNQTATPFQSESCVSRLFEIQAARTPEAIAVAFEGEHLTYRDLNLRANQLAHYLLRGGVGPESLVALRVERSLTTMIGLLGILKAGGAYLPLDPSHPKERIAHILEETGLSVILTERSLLEGFPPNEARVICLDSEWDAISLEGDQNPEVAAGPRNPAYVIYTSGSTGKPKGVVIEHRSVANLSAGLNHSIYSRHRSPLRVSVNAPLAFDSSVKQIIQLLCGHALYIVPEEARSDGKELIAFLERNRLDVIDCTPSQLKLMLQAGLQDSPELAALVFLIGGEALPGGAWKFIRRQERHSFYNVYGPTECTVDATVCHVQASFQEPLIGRPIANAKIYILDENLSPVPTGAAGELHIGGAGLARGYVMRPELTAESFIPDPFSDEPGARLYKTGDLARYRPDGNIVFMGRKDHQVKLRGYRVELAEIEAVMARQAGIRDAVVLMREDNPDDKRLVAYAVAEKAGPPPAGELRDRLKAALPEYMVPSAYVFLDELPLNSNGKVDRNALPPPDQASSHARPSYGTARTPNEELLAGIWEDVLGVGRLGVDENFFDLGGHSLLATQVMARVRAAFGVELPLRRLFEEPTVARLAASIDAQRAAGGFPSPPIVPVPRGGSLPLSFAQQRLWFLDQYEPGNPFYNVATAVQFTGGINVSALGRAFREVIRRHEVLRTSFPSVEGSPVQKASAPGPMNLPVIDLCGLREEVRQAEASRLAAEDARRAFNLSEAPLLRATLIRLSEQEHWLLFTKHHIVSDYWSREILINEVSALYNAFSQGKPSPLPELPVQYADYAVWQRQWLRGEVLEAKLAYWKQEMEGSPPLLSLPYDRPRPPIQTFNGATEPLIFPPDLSESIKALSRREGATMFMTLLAAFESLLFRYSGQEDIVVGTPIANRDRIETEKLIGFFINTLVLRSDFSGNPGFRHMLARVRDKALTAYANQDLPFEKLVEEIQPERNLSYSPLFQVVFVLQNPSANTPDAGDLKARFMGVNSKSAKFDLTLFLVNAEHGLSGSMEYNTDLFGQATISRMLGHLRALLEGVVADPDRPVSAIPLLSQSERHQLLVEWNNTRADYPRNSCIHELFETQVAQTPRARAIEFEESSLTYAELNGRANQLARKLRALGVGPEVVVGLFMERSLDMAVGILSVLKAGGAYLPLDQSYPQERLAFMLEDARASVVLTQERLTDRLPGHSQSLISIDAEWEVIARESAENLASVAWAESLAYVMYTSGSTGRPKGVAVPHRAVVRLVKNTNYVELSSEETILQFAPISFDASTLEIWASLLTGARLVLYPAGVASTHELAAAIRRRRITTMWLTAGLFHQMAEHNIEGFENVRQLLAGGDVLSPRHVRNVLGQVSGIKIINGYGPTENTTFTCCHRVNDADQLNSSIPIGKPISNTQVYILDRHMQPVPLGVFGELYAGGDGLARGYFNKPDLTAERFAPDPFGGEPGGRLYRTGDAVRYLPDGAIEFQGRNDNQVKLRGYRIELNEIELMLEQHPSIQSAAVVIREDGAGNKSLTGYVVAGGGAPVAPRELRSFLREKLPDYMIPSAFVILDELPLTPNGKVDRKALPAPEHAEAESEEDFDTLPTPIAEVLAGIFAEVLGLERVRLHDNFFELGGHSLLASQAVSRVRQALKVDLPLRKLFESPTVSSLARSIEMSSQAGHGIEIPPITRADRTREMPLSFAQQRLWFLNQLDPDSPAYNITNSMRLDGDLSVEVLERTLGEIIRRHETLRTSFVAGDGTPRQVISAPAPAGLPVVDLSGLSEEAKAREARRLVTRESQRPFDLQSGPLLRVRLIRLAGQEHVVVLATHHIVCDGWSVGIFIREVARLYEAFSEGGPSPLPEPGIQYADFAIWERAWLRDDLLQEHLDYWTRQLGPKLPVLRLPTDRPRPSIQTFKSGLRSFMLPEGVSQSLRELSRKEGVTLFMTLLAAFQTLLHRYTNQDDIVVGTDIAGRTQVETEGLIGLFVNHLVMRTDMNGNPTFRDLLSRVREVALGAYAHQSLPFDKLVEALRPERDLSRFPLFQVLFVLQNAPRSSLRLPGLTLVPFKGDENTVKFDLALFMSEKGKSLSGAWSYNAELFTAETIDRMSGHFSALLESVVAAPDARLSALDMLTEKERDRQKMERHQRESSRLEKLMKARPKVIKLSQVNPVKQDYLQEGQTLPLLLTPSMEDVDLVSWASSNAAFIEENLLKHGALLFRGFNPGSAAEFERFAQAICPNLFGEYGDLPREQAGGKVYSSTPYPADKTILFHNESSHLHRWPMKIWFFCTKAAEQGGETPIIDCRKVYRTLKPETAGRFEEKRVRYVRNFTDGLDVDWKEFFHTPDRSAVEDYCRRAEIECEWRAGDRLRTSQVCRAVSTHPKTGEKVFFNQIQLFHVSCIEPDVRQSLSSLFAEEEFPRNVYYGDGSPIEDSVIEEIRGVYAKLAVSFPWREGDVLMLDNMLVAHSRNPYVGQRKINVAMGEMIGKDDI